VESEEKEEKEEKGETMREAREIIEIEDLDFEGDVISQMDRYTPECFEEIEGELFLAWEGNFSAEPLIRLGKIERRGWNGIVRRFDRIVAMEERNTVWSLVPSDSDDA
jgi:hypothetical protein